MSLSPEAPAIRARLASEQIRALYHFTCIENLPGIAQAQAIWSKEELESAGRWPPPRPGGNTQSHVLDRSQGNWNKVSLLFSPHTPMAYNMKSEIHMCFFEVSVEVACWEGVNFSNSNATSQHHRRLRGVAGLDLVNFDLVRSAPQPLNFDWLHFSQAEVLVPRRVSLSAVNRVIFVSSASRKEALRLWGDNPLPRFEVETEPFESWPGNSFTGFSYISDAFLASSTSSTATNRFDRHHTSEIVAHVTVEALTGTTAVAQWEPAGIEERKEFRSTDHWDWTPKMSLGQLPNGRCFLELHLDDIRWMKIPFEVV